ncbi:alpha amylase C-terminal domain-containing protein [Caballeronia sp. ATUFL_M2_KS44]|uniref:alpha amylase C-terminal domain-containing protein n=1 Tax=Caballeronia sp. ATUFL_M2_KS44 TaxID=2921767 RepID=UPI002027C216|nr:alpha amylase C-terminal domain-containing protein [Caballeronia sp. ATUFL_M2_KS44]
MVMPTLGNVKMGANLVQGGATFRLWAPCAQRVYVITGERLPLIDTSGFAPADTEALFNLGDGSCSGFVPGLADGSPYRFWVTGNGSTGPKRDPRARELSIVPAYPRCDCIIRDVSRYPWHDDAYRPPAFNDLMLYQLHIGVFYAVDAAGMDKRRGIGKYLDLLDRVDYLADLGINGVQLLPVQEHPTETSRGYNGLDLYSPEMDYQVNDPAERGRYLTKANALLAARGKAPLSPADIEAGQDQLKCVIDIFHLSGIAVLFDLVFNHAGGGFNDQCLEFLDRQPYGDENRSLYFTDHQWVGGYVFAYWNDGVRGFLIDNVRQCLEEYHIDGVRYDEVTVIDANGGGRFCQDVSSTARAEKSSALQIAEYWGSDRAAAVRAPPNGLGFDAAWSDRLRLGVRGALSQMRGGSDAFVDMQNLAASLAPPDGFGEAWRAVNMLEDHDIVFVERDLRVAALASNDSRSWYARSRARVALGLLFASPGIPQLFMGQEIFEDKQWSDDTNFHANLLIWWDGLAVDGVMRDYHSFCRDLIRLRAAYPALRGERVAVYVVNEQDRVIGIHRWIEGSGQDVLVVANLQEQNRFGYRIGFPGAGTWREIFNSDVYEGYPNPQPAGNGGRVIADSGPWGPMPNSAQVTLPANGFIAFAR